MGGSVLGAWVVSPTGSDRRPSAILCIRLENRRAATHRLRAAGAARGTQNSNDDDGSVDGRGEGGKRTIVQPPIPHCCRYRNARWWHNRGGGTRAGSAAGVEFAR